MDHDALAACTYITTFGLEMDATWTPKIDHRELTDFPTWDVERYTRTNTESQCKCAGGSCDGASHRSIVFPDVDVGNRYRFHCD